MIIDNSLRQYFEHHPINKELEAGLIQGSFFEYHEDGALPDGLFEISDEHGFAVSQIAPDGKEWVFDEEAQHPILVDLLYDIDEVRQVKYVAINAWRNSQEADDSKIVTVNDIEWDAGPSARTRIESTLASEFMPAFWTDAENIDQPIDGVVLKAIHTEIVKVGFEIHARQRQMKQELQALTTVEEIQAYEIGWPE